MTADINPDRIPDRWALSSNHDNHVSIVLKSNPRYNISAHSMASQTEVEGWFAVARPGTDKIVAEAAPLPEVIDQMFAAARQYNETEEYQLVRRGSVIEKYTDSSDDDSQETESSESEPSSSAGQTSLETWVSE